MQWKILDKAVTNIYPFNCSNRIFVSTGMHKKSLEAASKMKEEEDDENSQTDTKPDTDVRTESIAALRAKAQQHSSKMLEVLHKNENCEKDNPGNSFNSSFLSDTDVSVCHDISRQ